VSKEAAVQFFMMNTAEWRSDRFLRLCEYMEMDATEEQQVLLRGYFSTFVCQWAQDLQTDSGLFFNTPVRRLGIWARCPNPEKFGNGLMACGYVFDMKEKYPASVLGMRSGLVFWGALDITWRSVHSERMNARDLVLFLADPVKRSRLAHRMGIRPEDHPGWLLTKDSLRDAPAPEGDAEDGEGTRGSSAGGPAVAPAGDPPAPHLPPRDGHVKEKNEIKQREHVGRTKKRGARTGRAPSSQQLAALRHWKNEDIGRALLELDDGERARQTWAAICEHDRPFAYMVISELVETDAAYKASNWPPGLVFARCEGRLRQLNVDATQYVVTGRATPERGGGGIGFGS
jgi:hypothetical protein